MPISPRPKCGLVLYGPGNAIHVALTPPGAHAIGTALIDWSQEHAPGRYPTYAALLAFWRDEGGPPLHEEEAADAPH